MGRDTIATWSSAVWLAEPTDSGGYIYIHRHWNGRAKAYVYSTPGGTWAKCTMCSALLNVPVRRLGRRMSARASLRRQPSSRKTQGMQENSHQPVAAAGTIRKDRAAQADQQTTRAMARVTVGPKGGGWRVSGGGGRMALDPAGRHQDGPPGPRPVRWRRLIVESQRPDRMQNLRPADRRRSP